MDIKIAYSKYSDFDDKVIYKASELGLPLIGGTALEVWANYYNVPGVRKRSNNDLDFISNDLPQINEFQSWVRENIYSSKVKVDVMHVQSHDFSEYIREVNGVLIMAPEYLLWSKFIRSDRSDKDIKDIKWLLTIEQMSDEDLSNALVDLGVTDEEIETLNNLL
ncbi:MAG: hypothetical protein E7071_05385 [Bacteroidales bacterium]|nr:hypothetical protein [Bacteroidales bacterium]